MLLYIFDTSGMQAESHFRYLFKCVLGVNFLCTIKYFMVKQQYTILYNRIFIHLYGMSRYTYLCMLYSDKVTIVLNVFWAESCRESLQITYKVNFINSPQLVCPIMCHFSLERSLNYLYYVGSRDFVQLC